MDSDLAIRLLMDALLTAAKISAPILLASLAVGLLISIFQVVTQIQEMTLTFVPKLAIVVVICFVFGNWMLSMAIEMAKRMFETAAGM